MKVKVAVLQYEVPEESEKALEKLSEMAGQASWSGAKLVVAPETALGEFSKVKKPEHDYLEEMKKIAKASNVFLATSFYHLEKGKVYDQGYIVSDEGREVLDHKKIYLAQQEIDDKISTGNYLKAADTKIGKLGMLICKDGFTRYSHFLYQKFNDLGADIICASTWSLGWKNTVGNDVYVKQLYIYGSLISRAYVLMSGNLNKSTESFGKSLIISPVTGVMKEASRDRKEILFEEIDLDEVKRIREFDSRWQPKRQIKIN